MNRRRLLFALPAALAAVCAPAAVSAQNYMPQPTPAPPAGNQELTERVTVLEFKDAGILAVLKMMNDDLREIAAHLGHPGPHYPERSRPT